MKRIITAVVAVLAAAATAACSSSAVDGSGSRQGGATSPAGGDSSVHGGFTTDGASSPAPGSASASGPSTPAASAPTSSGRPLVFQGTTTGKTYAATVWGSDDLTDCAAHAYGAKMIAFLHQHLCRGAHRVLATVELEGHTVAVSVVAASFAGTAQDPYVYAGRFKQLEEADGTGSIDDLLREGGHIPGVPGGIPPNEAFTVLAQDNGVQVLDAWYVVGSTKDQDPALVRLEQDVFLSALSSA